MLQHLILLDGENNGNETNRKLNVHSFDSLISNDGKIEQSVIQNVSADDPAMIMFTSVSL
jgi:acyl-coenzyme A synthetase/AMP-(fatty) acid ligase